MATLTKDAQAIVDAMFSDEKLIGVESEPQEMKISVDGDLLKAALKNLIKFDLDVIFTTDARGLKLFTAGDVTVEHVFGTEGVKVICNGDFCLPIKAAKILAATLEDERVTLSVSYGDLIVDALTQLRLSGNKKIKLDFTEKNYSAKITLPAITLKQLINNVIYAAGKDLRKPIFTGVNFGNKNGTLTLSATNGDRLAVAFSEQLGGDDFNCTIPAEILKAILPLLAKNKEIVLEVGETFCKFIFGNLSITSRLLEGEYPDVQKNLPNIANVALIVDACELGNAINIVKPFAGASDEIKITLNGAQLELYAEKIATGERAQATIPTEYSRGAELGAASFEINCKYLLDALKNRRAILIGITEKQVTITTENTRNIIAPMKNSVVLPKLFEDSSDVDVKIKVA